MKEFAYTRPETIGEAVALLDEYGDDARLLAGGTDLVIGFREGWIRPKLVIDLKRVEELRPSIQETDGLISISASTVMADITHHAGIQKHFPAPFKVSFPLTLESDHLAANGGAAQAAGDALSGQILWK